MLGEGVCLLLQGFQISVLDVLSHCGEGIEGAVIAFLDAEGDMDVQGDRAHDSSSIFSTAMKASEGTWTEPKERIRFLPSFCFSKSFFLRVMSPP